MNMINYIVYMFYFFAEPISVFLYSLSLNEIQFKHISAFLQLLPILHSLKDPSLTRVVLALFLCAKIFRAFPEITF